MRYPYMICPARDLGTNVFSQVTCRPNPVFVWRDFEFTGVAKHVLQTIVRAILSSRFFWIMAHFFFFNVSSATPRLPSPTPPSKSIVSLWLPLRLWSLPLAASLLPVSSELSTSRTLVTLSLDTVV